MPTRSIPVLWSGWSEKDISAKCVGNIWPCPMIISLPWKSLALHGIVMMLFGKNIGSAYNCTWQLFSPSNWWAISHAIQKLEELEFARNGRPHVQQQSSSQLLVQIPDGTQENYHCCNTGALWERVKDWGWLVEDPKTDSGRNHKSKNAI